MTDREAIEHALAHLRGGPKPDIAAEFSTRGKSPKEIDNILGRRESTADHYLN